MKPRTPVVLTILVSVLALGLSGAHAQTVLHVDDDAPLGGDGTSWSSPFKYLQDALAAASADPTVNEIRVAGGVYKPDRDEAGNVMAGDREATFQLLNGVVIRGGYAGYGASMPDERDTTAFSTILSGNINSDDPDTPGYSDCCTAHESGGCDDATCSDAVCAEDSRCCQDQWTELCGFGAFYNLCTDLCQTTGENSYHVVTSSGTDETAVLDGLIITRGNADGEYPHDRGGGVLNIGGNPTLNNCTFDKNAAFSLGGGMYNEEGSPTLSTCAFNGNVSASGSGPVGGGGMSSVSSSPTLMNCTFSANLAANFGGGFVADLGTLTMLDCTLSGNFANTAGGGASINGSQATLTRCMFIENHVLGGEGGALVRGGNVTFTDCVFSGNDGSPTTGGGITFGWASEGAVSGCTFADNVGSGIAFVDSYPTITNSTFLRNSARSGGGVYANLTNAVAGRPLFTNCIFSGNQAENVGGGAYFTGSGHAAFVSCTFFGNTAPLGGGMSVGLGAVLDDCILWGNQDAAGDQESAQVYVPPYSALVDINYSDVQGWTGALGGVGNFGADPLFIDADGEDDIVGTEDDDLRLSSGSPCIDAGDNSAVPGDWVDLDGDGDTTEPTPLDLDWLPRFVDDVDTPDTGVSTPGIPEIVDMGAYEYQDCNDNGENDALDIAEGTSDDCNESMVPDECEEDSDGDGVIDECESCPDDPDKLEPGVCGCGVPDDDTDGDGTEDCNDGCPDDPGKVTPGVCGCGVPEDDADGDTVPDCADQCPGQDDRIDEDQDGTPDCLEPEVIPTTTLWGAVILGLLLLAGGKIGFGRRSIERPSVPPSV